MAGVTAPRSLYGVTLKKPWDTEEVLPAPRQPQKLPVVASPEKVVQLPGCVACVQHRAILTAYYAAALRISGAVSVRPTDIDGPVHGRERGKGQAPRVLAQDEVPP